MERVAKLLKDEHAQLWINHDKEQSAGIAHAPEAVR
jgi:ABC-type iron transport system FetAB ATPase subunit